ncbi:MAG: hypothetical protein GKR99_10395 [Rhodobacteraceae bacterium]|nr:hypothetical protein [Paracoccaceae bacterium]
MERKIIVQALKRSFSTQSADNQSGNCRTTYKWQLRPALRSLNAPMRANSARIVHRGVEAKSVMFTGQRKPFLIRA